MRHASAHKGSNVSSLVGDGGVAAQHLGDVGARLESIGAELQLVGTALGALVGEDGDDVDAGWAFGGCHGAVVEVKLCRVVRGIARIDVDGLVAEVVEGRCQGV